MGNFVPLSDIFNRGSQTGHVAFLRDGGAISWAEFERDVACFAHQVGAKPQSKWLLYCDDAYWFTVGLLALASVGKDIILPPNMQMNSIQDMSGDVDAVLTDREGHDAELTLIKLEALSETQGRILPVDFPDLDHVSLTLKTSGSTGEPKHIRKTLGALEREIFKLEDKWKLSERGGIVASTVSHFHIYGILYQILWPLMARVKTWVRRIDYPEQLDIVTRYGDLILISSPAFLTRWDDVLMDQKSEGSEREGLLAMSDHLAMIFSSGGKLPDLAGARLSNLLSTPIYEIYGSTETGGVAIKQLGQEDCLTVMTGVNVRVSNDGGLSVHSDHTGSSDWIDMGDKVVFRDEACFTITGRADRIEKVEEKRVSLTEMERHLTALDEVEEVRLMVLRGGKRAVIAAAVVLSAAGESQLSVLGKREFVARLRGALGGYYEAVLLPRKWRFMAEMPYNTQGKIELAPLMKMFEKQSDTKEHLPDYHVKTQQEAKVTLAIFAPRDLLCFDGHFDEFPIVPGVVQLDWAFILGRKYFSFEQVFGGAEILKYMNIIQADDKILLSLNYDAEKAKIYFKYFQGEKIYSSGRILLADRP